MSTLRMHLTQALETIEYRIATESESFEHGHTIRLDIHTGWPQETELADALRRKHPYINIRYNHQPNDCLQLLITNTRADK